VGGGKRQDRRTDGRAEATPAAADVARLVHELEVHRVELELQNEELRAARVEIEAGLARYAELFDVAPIAYFVLGPDGGILDLNWAASRLLGVDRTGLAGRRLATYLARDDQAILGRLVTDVLLDLDRGGAPERACELVRLSRPSGAVDVRICVAPLPGQGDAVLVAGEDVTAQRAAEDALREESRRKDEFLAALSHELRNPLAPIRNGLGLLSRAPAGSEQAIRALHVVERQVAHLSHLVDDLLDVTRIARGKVRLHREPVELGELVRRTVEDHRPTFDHAGVAVDARLARDPCWVLADATRVAQIVGNLLGNAAKFTAPGGRVEVSVRREADAAAVRIADTGVGIAPEVQERLFEPFNQAPQTLDRTRGGLGLGLATVKGLVELHGGSVALSSAGEGRGAEFTVRLPLTAAPAATREATRPAAGDHRRVLVVDDNEDAASTLKELLALSGHEVRVALDGPQGVAAAREFLPDLVICDIGLPGMDGYAVARALRAVPATHDAYLVALSGYALPDDLRRAADAGFDRHLAKPLALDSLERALAEAWGAPRRPSGAAHSPEAGSAGGA
jgi:two-component system CheB/CheR fusion protein